MTAIPSHTLQVIYTKEGLTQINPVHYPQQFAAVDVITPGQWIAFVERLADIGKQAVTAKGCCACCCYSYCCKVCTIITLVFEAICWIAWFAALMGTVSNGANDGGTLFVFTYQVGMYSVFILITLFGMYSCHREVTKGRDRRYQFVMNECASLETFHRLSIEVSPPQTNKSYWFSQVTISVNNNVQPAANYQHTQAIPLTVQQPQVPPQQMVVQMPDGTYVTAQVINSGAPVAAQPAVAAPPYNPNAVHAQYQDASVPLQVQPYGEGDNGNHGETQNYGAAEGAVTNY